MVYSSGIGGRPSLPRPLTLVMIADRIPQHLKAPGERDELAYGLCAPVDSFFHDHAHGLLYNILDVTVINAARCDSHELAPQVGQPFACLLLGVSAIHKGNLPSARISRAQFVNSVTENVLQSLDPI
jgi:hypothetical protein